MSVKAEPCLEPSPISMMELFCKNSQRLSAIFAKSFLMDVALGSKYASEKTEAFKMKLRLAKSLRLLQRAAFLVLFCFSKELKR